MSTVQTGDVIAVYRGGTLYHAPADMSTVQDTDLIVVGRGNTPYKCTFADWKASQVAALSKATDTTIAGAANAGSTLTATAGTATGGTAPITYATKWQISADGSSGWADIAGATALTYAIQAGDKDKYLRAVTTATDSTAPTAQTLDLPSVASAKVTDPPSINLGWNADTDAYTRDPVADRAISAQVLMRRCVLADGGAVAYYLDADNSTKQAGDWLRLCETTELNGEYTGTHGAEVANTGLRTAAPAWAAGTYTKGQRVQHSGSVWECLAATTTATPAAGTKAAVLTGAVGQVMVEIPKFSVWHETAPAGAYLQHSFHLQLGDRTGGGWEVHPAFVKPDGATRSHIYIGAYQGTGVNGNGSASGVKNYTNSTRGQCRNACASRGSGWHQLGYWEYNAVQWLLYTEYQNMNSQKVLGNGAMQGGVFQVNTGPSNARGNRSGNSYTTGGGYADYVSYRGVENIYGRANQWVDGFNIYNHNVYLSNNPAVWADDTLNNYTAAGTVPSVNNYIRDLLAQTAFLPGSTQGANGFTFVGDHLYTSTGWCGGAVGGRAADSAHIGALCLMLNYTSAEALTAVGSRLSYAAQ